MFPKEAAAIKVSAFLALLSLQIRCVAKRHKAKDSVECRVLHAVSTLCSIWIHIIASVYKAIKAFN